MPFCYHCETGEMMERPKSFTCKKCGLIIWKTISGKKIEKALAVELFTSGRTAVLGGFVSKKARPFKAALEITSSGEVKFKFPETGTQQLEQPSIQDKTKDVWVRLEADRSGVAKIVMRGAIEQSLHIEFGLKPARMTECLALITALKIIKHRAPKVSILTISCNNLDFSRYLLRERYPRDKEMRQTLTYLNQVLGEFKQWVVAYEKSRNQQLKGSSRARFAFGAFPWLKAIAHKHNGKIKVILPDDPAVIAHFRASFWKVEKTENQGNPGLVEYKISENAEQALKTWLATVSIQKLDLFSK